MSSLARDGSFAGFAEVGLNLQHKAEIGIGKLLRAALLGSQRELIAARTARCAPT